jgi:steroid delta-isomerase-like uncharacterized protein
MATVPEMQAVLDTYLSAANRHDGETQLAQMCDDAFFEVIPMRLRLESKPAIAAYWGSIMQLLPDYGRRINGITRGEDLLVVSWALLGTVRGAVMGFDATGNKIDVPMVSFFHFADGRIKSERVLYDVATLCDQAGVSIERVRRTAMARAP